MTVRPTEDTAQVIIGDQAVGLAHWSMSDDPLVVVSVEPSAILLVQEWAAAMGGEFREEFWEGWSDS